jgi:hypothetical protein
MAYNKKSAKVGSDHPVHLLFLAADSIIDAANAAATESGTQVRNRQLIIPVWMESHPVIKITIECGPETEAEYAIFKAQTK